MKKVTVAVEEDEYSDSSETASLLPKNETRTSNKVMILSSLIMLIGAFASGTMLGFSSPLIPGIQNDTEAGIHVGETESSWIGSLLSVGGIVGGLSAGIIMQAVGRKFTAILSGVPYVGGLLLIFYASNVYMIYVGRFITGVGLAFTVLVVPTYVGEIATHAYRGLLGSGNQLAITIGILFVYGIGGLISWRWLAFTTACIPVVFIFLCLFIPESPRHLYLKSKRRESAATLQLLRGKQADITDELRELHDCACASFEEAKWTELVTDRAIRTPLLLNLANMFFQQISGINCIMFYAQSIFQNAGFNTPSQLRLALILIAGIQVIFTFISCIAVDRSGRKVLWSISSLAMCLSMVAFGLYFQLKATHSGITWLALLSMMVYMASFSIGLGPLPWLLMVELLPLRAKGKCGGIVTMVNLFLCFLITKEFSDLKKAITPQGTFWLFAGVCFASLIYGIFLLPETKGKSLEEIQAYFEGRSLQADYQEVERDNDVKA